MHHSFIAPDAAEPPALPAWEWDFKRLACFVKLHIFTFGQA
jgi:hypothetical protein